MFTCKNCGKEFEGNFCPQCGAQTTYEPEPVQQPVAEENPYSKAYSEPVEQPRPAYYQQPQNIPPQQYYQPQYLPQYQYPQPPKSGMTAGKIVGIIFAVVAGIIVLNVAYFGTAFSLIACTDNILEETHDLGKINVGDTIKSDIFAYSFSKPEFDDKYGEKDGNEGYTLMSVDVEVTNISSEEQYSDLYVSCYADDYLCYDLTSDNYYTEIDAGKKFKTLLQYKVPVDAESITLKVSDDDAFNYFGAEFEVVIK